MCAMEVGGGCSIDKPSSADFTPQERYDTVKDNYDSVSE